MAEINGFLIDSSKLSNVSILLSHIFNSFNESNKS